MTFNPTSSVQAPGNDALGAYWLRTLGLFAGFRVRVAPADGRAREGLLTDASHIEESGVLIPIPLGQVCSVAAL